MDDATKAAIGAVRPKHSRRKRWRQYSALVRRFYLLVPLEDMDAVCRAVADKLGL